MDAKKVLGREYRPRVIDQELERGLSAAGCVVIEGARASGKTMTALNAANSFVFVDDHAVQETLEVAPSSVLTGEAPRLLDEWQLAPQLWNLVRRAVDADPEPGRFILTGSATPSDDVTRHTGAGRMLRLKQRTMTWFEKSDTTNPRVSLRGLFEGERPESDLTHGWGIEEIVSEILRPGFPAIVNSEADAAAMRMRAYIDEVVRTDIHRIADVRHDPDLLRQLIAAMARSVASDVSYETLASDVRVLAPSINAVTVSRYVDLLERLFIVEFQRPWAPKLKSRARLRRSPKLHLVDPALSAAALGAGTNHLLNDLQTLGALFESAVVHDLMVFASALEGEVRHYRDSNGKEIDAVVSLPDGRWGAVEVKLGGGQVKAGIESLNEVLDQIDTESVGQPSFRLVVTGTGPIFTADDGTIVAPLRHIGP